MDRHIAKGEITDIDTGIKYVLNGVKLSENFIVGGRGYYLTIREHENLPTEYFIQLLTEESFNGSVAIRSYSEIVAKIKNFIYRGSEEI